MTRPFDDRISFDTLDDSEALEDVLRKVLNEYNESPQIEEETMKDILRRWIRIEAKMQQLTGGVSGAGVYRVQVEIGVPTFNENAPRLTFPSLIVKTNTKEAFRKEFENYHRLPPNLRDRFAKMERSLEPMVNEVLGKREVVYYMIMEDLMGYRPFHDIIFREKHDEAYLSKLVSEIWKSLQIIHCYKEDVPIVAQFSSLYLGAMQDALTKAVETHSTLRRIMASDHTVGSTRLCPVNDYWPKLSALSDHFKPPFLTYMHGDLHSKNILIKDHIEHEWTEFDVKLIDIDKMEVNGDYVCDIGELVSYIEVIGPVISGSFRFEPKPGGKTIDYEINSNQTADFAGEEFSKKLKELDGKDKYCNQRFQLAQAKALFSFIPYVKDDLQATILYCEGVKKIEESIAPAHA